MKSLQFQVVLVLTLGVVSAQVIPTLNRHPAPTEGGVIVLPMPDGGKAVPGKSILIKTPPAATPGEYRLELIRWLMSFPSPLENGIPQLRSMGDEAAMDVRKVLATKSSLPDAEKQTILDIVHTSFEQPASILIPAYKNPAETVLLLQELAKSSGDAAIQQRVREELFFVQTAQLR